MARLSPINLLRHDFEEAAEYIKKSLRRRFPCVALINNDFNLQLLCSVSDWELERLNKQPNFVGYYTNTTPIEIIEEDILMWLRKCHTQVAMQEDQK